MDREDGKCSRGSNIFEETILAERILQFVLRVSHVLPVKGPLKGERQTYKTV